VFDVITARAVAPLVQLVSWVEPLLKPTAQMLFLKGGDLEAEIAEAVKKFPTLAVEEIAIEMSGTHWFKAQEKKLLICRLGS
jgi:16S rRNA G527 N7-methylase RsmG